MTGRWDESETKISHRFSDLEYLPEIPENYRSQFLNAADRIQSVAQKIRESQSEQMLKNFGVSDGTSGITLALLRDDVQRNNANHTGYESKASHNYGEDGPFDEENSYTYDNTFNNQNVNHPHDIVQNQINSPSATSTIRDEMMIPAHKTGLIIGTHGESLKRIERISQCRVILDQSSNNNPNAPERRLIIVGLEQDVLEAKRLIKERLGEGSFPGSSQSGSGGLISHIGGSQGAMGPRSSPDLIVNIPGNKVGLIIGKGGDTIKQIQEVSGAKVAVQAPPNNQPEHLPHETRLVSVWGDQNTTMAAKALVEGLASGIVRTDGSSGRLVAVPHAAGSYLASLVPIMGGVIADSRSGNYNAGARIPGTNTTTIQILDSTVGLVIGKKAETLRNLQSTSGCRIFVDPGNPNANPPNMYRDIHLSGTPEQIAYAHQLIMDRVARGEARILTNTYSSMQQSNTAPFSSTNAESSAGVVYQSPTELCNQNANTFDYASYYYQYYYQQQQQSGMPATPAAYPASSYPVTPGNEYQAPNYQTNPSQYYTTPGQGSAQGSTPSSNPYMASANQSYDYSNLQYYPQYQ